MVRTLSKKPRLRKRFDREHVKVSEILAKSLSQHIYHVFSSLRGKLIGKMSPILLGEILGIFLNTLTAEGKYFIEEWENL